MSSTTSGTNSTRTSLSNDGSEVTIGTVTAVLETEDPTPPDPVVDGRDDDHNHQQRSHRQQFPDAMLLTQEPSPATPRAAPATPGTPATVASATTPPRRKLVASLGVVGGRPPHTPGTDAASTTSATTSSSPLRLPRSVLKRRSSKRGNKTRSSPAAPGGSSSAVSTTGSMSGSVRSLQTDFDDGGGRNPTANLPRGGRGFDPRHGFPGAASTGGGLMTSPSGLSSVASSSHASSSKKKPHLVPKFLKPKLNSSSSSSSHRTAETHLVKDAKGKGGKKDHRPSDLMYKMCDDGQVETSISPTAAVKGNAAAAAKKKKGFLGRLGGATASPSATAPASVASPPSIDVDISDFERQHQRALEFQSEQLLSQERNEYDIWNDEDARRLRERDGFCRQVDKYDGQVITVDGKDEYELGNYLGGGVAGVVYEALRLGPPSEYYEAPRLTPKGPPKRLVWKDPGVAAVASPARSDDDIAIEIHEKRQQQKQPVVRNARNPSFDASGSSPVVDRMDAPNRSSQFMRAASAQTNSPPKPPGGVPDIEPSSSADYLGLEENVAIKILNPVGFRLLPPTSFADSNLVVLKKGVPMSDDVKRHRRPMQEHHVWWVVHPNSKNLRSLLHKPTSGPASRKLTPSNSDSSINNPMSTEGKDTSASGSRQDDDATAGTADVDRGTATRGIRLSVIAAYKCPKSNQLRELPLGRCIEIWGQAPFGASEEEFEQMMDAIERTNSGSPGEADQDGDVSGKAQGIDVSGSSRDANSDVETGLDRAAASQTPNSQNSKAIVFSRQLSAFVTVPVVPPKYLRWLRQRRSATKEIRNMMRIGRHKNVVHLYEVLELIQDTKSTMFLVLELVKGGELFDLISSSAQSQKESSDGSNNAHDESVLEGEKVMKKFFAELASGIAYCHSNGIAHRDLKPENLLVHTASDGESTLKIADFGLSATFAITYPPSENGTLHESDSGCNGLTTLFDTEQQNRNESSNMSTGPVSTPTAAPGNQTRAARMGASRNNSDNSLTNWEDYSSSPGPTTGLSPLDSKQSLSLTDMMTRALGTSTVSFLTCGAIGGNDINTIDGVASVPKQARRKATPSPLRRMTSVVGSPHYVAPEIVAQASSAGSHDEDDDVSAGTSAKMKRGNKSPDVVGYDGTKVDVWSAGVILYAMLFRSLPFGEDLFRCPRYISFYKWYDEARRGVPRGRRSSGAAALVPLRDDPSQPSELEELLGPHWFFPQDTSRESRDLIVAMLNPDPVERLSIDMVLRHPWLLEEQDTKTWI